MQFDRVSVYFGELHGTEQQQSNPEPEMKKDLYAEYELAAGSKDKRGEEMVWVNLMPGCVLSTRVAHIELSVFRSFLRLWQHS